MAYDIFIFLLDVTRKSHPRYGYLSSQMKGFTYIEMYTLVGIDVAANTQYLPILQQQHLTVVKMVKHFFTRTLQFCTLISLSLFYRIWVSLT